MEEKSLLPTTKQKIIDCTLELIAQNGLQNVSIRKIASAAGVNVAAVNYHFGSKSQLIDAALAVSFGQMKAIFGLLKETSRPPDERLRNFLEKYLEYLYLYPDLTKNFILQHILERSIQDSLQAYLFSEGIQLLKSTLRQLSPTEDQTNLAMKTTQLLGCLAYPVLLGDTLEAQLAYSLEQPEARQRYVTLMLKGLA
jgi:AcrR family transcriptional regulator